MFSLAEVLLVPPVKCAGDSNGMLGGLDSPIWCIVGCFPVTNGLRGCAEANGRWSLICNGVGWLVLPALGVTPPKTKAHYIQSIK